MVTEKSFEVEDAVINAINAGSLKKTYGNDGISFSLKIDEKTLVGAALSHDTGMCGNGYALSPDLKTNGKQKKDSYGRKMFKKDSNGIYLVHQEDNSYFDEVRDNHSLNSAINVLINRESYISAGYTSDEVDKIAAICMAHSKSDSGISNLNRKYDWSDSFDRIDATVSAYNHDHPNLIITFNRAVIEQDKFMQENKTLQAIIHMQIM